MLDPDGVGYAGKSGKGRGCASEACAGDLEWLRYYYVFGGVGGGGQEPDPPLQKSTERRLG